jgi:hypothetical protein
MQLSYVVQNINTDVDMGGGRVTGWATAHPGISGGKTRVAYCSSTVVLLQYL